MNDYNFGNFIFTLRSEKGLSQSQLGQLLGVTNKAVSKWENGSSKPNTKLIPRLAEILDITVEELFAGRRFNSDTEWQNTKKLLIAQRQRYAVLTSVFLSLTVILPFLLAEFVCIIMGFSLPDEVAGPLGSVSFILLFVTSLTACIIYRNCFAGSVVPDSFTLNELFSSNIIRGIFISSIVLYLIISLIYPIYILILSLSVNPISANVFLCIAIFIFILIAGLLICLLNIKKLLAIKIPRRSYSSNKPMPLGIKICNIIVIALFPIVLNMYFTALFVSDLNTVKYLLMCIWLIFNLIIIAYNLKNRAAPSKEDSTDKRSDHNEE